MRRPLALTLALLLLLPLAALAQWETVTTNNVNPANTSQSIKIGPSSSSGIEITTGGVLKQTTADADGFAFIPAVGGCTGNTTNFAVSRVAANDWALARTSATVGGEEIFVHCKLDSWLQRAGGTKGLKITSVAIYHEITTLALVAATWGKIATVAYANNTANAIGPDRAVTPTLPTATQASPYLTTVSLENTHYGGAVYLPSTTNQALTLDYGVYLPNTSRYRLYGIGVNFSRLDH